MCVLHGRNGLCVLILLETVDGNWVGKIVFLIFRICVNKSTSVVFKNWTTGKKYFVFQELSYSTRYKVLLSYLRADLQEKVLRISSTRYKVPMSDHYLT